MAEYTDKDREAFRIKDRQQAKGYAVEQAIKILSSRLTVEDVLAAADKVSEYTAKELLSTTESTGSPNKSISGNKPTTPQNKPEPKKSSMSAKALTIFNALVAEYSKMGTYADDVKVDEALLKQKILDRFGRFPTQKESIQVVLKEIKPEDIMMKE